MSKEFLKNCKFFLDRPVHLRLLNRGAASDALDEPKSTAWFYATREQPPYSTVHSRKLDLIGCPFFSADRTKSIRTASIFFCKKYAVYMCVYVCVCVCVCTCVWMCV